MNILLHTIALEPARWTPRRVSRTLQDMAGPIARAGFRDIEIFEPHLALAEDEVALPAVLAHHGLNPKVLSSYMQLSPAKSDEGQFAREAAELLQRVRAFGFRKVRLFAGGGISPDDIAAIHVFAERVGTLANMLPEVEILLETHDGSIADRPSRILDVVHAIGLDNVALLWQPVVFTDAAAKEQWALQRKCVRHFHLQNRIDIAQFATLGEGDIQWADILRDAPAGVEASVEFVPKGILPKGGDPAEHFDFDAVLAQCVSEAQWVRDCLAAV